MPVAVAVLVVIKSSQAKLYLRTPTTLLRLGQAVLAGQLHRHQSPQAALILLVSALLLPEVAKAGTQLQQVERLAVLAVVVLGQRVTQLQVPQLLDKVQAVEPAYKYLEQDHTLFWEVVEVVLVLLVRLLFLVKPGLVAMGLLQALLEQA